MGFEYKISTFCTAEQLSNIRNFLQKHKYFDRNRLAYDKEFTEFRTAENTGVMPNLSIITEDDGIYICQHGSSYMWQDIEELKLYLQEEQIQYTIIDYQD
ncbi:hypothetical protein [Hymenobacter aerophilus]|uniref:hypothetical protein n=1 Tax=Hymenobacter aerophilus TaxID=119644 RepID=UPI0012FB2954|nr:hypothetical protein [Hymenobacter aerophilus]